MTLLHKLKIPAALQPGDTVAVVSPSWGGPATFPARYEAGKAQLIAQFGLQVREMKHTRKSASWLAKNPAARADDLMEAFANPRIKGVFASIGGSDSIRLWPHMDLSVIRDNPKVYTGYSDTTVTHFMCLAAGVRSYYGAAIMVEYAENGGMHEFTANSIRKTLFSTAPIGPIEPSRSWTEQHLAWEVEANQHIKRRMQKNHGVRVLQGKGVATGRAIAMCADLFPMLSGTGMWPKLDVWQGAVLFIETSEDAPAASDFTYWLRNMGVQGILERLSGIVLARPMRLSKANFHQYDTALLNVVRDEFGLKNLPLIAQADFGHTAPQFMVPYGALVELNCKTGGIAFTEAGVR